MADGNKRYLGDVFINEENAERQRQFLRDIVESYEYKNNGTFDASTLRGMVPEDFATREQGERAEYSLLSPLYIGKSPILNDDGPQYIYTDGVLLDKTGALNLISWYENLEDNNVTDALQSIYNHVISIQQNLQNDIDSKADGEEFNTLQDTLDGVLETFTDTDGEEVTKINASLVNGLRFILITQDAYDDLPTADKEYWRNIFIIRDAADIPPDYATPMTWELENGYNFRVNNGYLQCTNGLSDQWKNICSLDDLFGQSDFNTIVKNFVENNEEYILDDQSLLASLEQISPGDINLNWENYPFLSSSLHDDFVYDLTLNNTKTYVTETTDNNSFKNINIDMTQILKDNEVLSVDGSTVINNLQDTLNNQINDLNTAKNTLSGVQQDVQDLIDNGIDINEINSQLTSLQNGINAANTNISTLNTKISNLGKWTKYTLSAISADSNIFYNRDLKLAYIQVQKNISYKVKNQKTNVRLGSIPNSLLPIQGFKAPGAVDTVLYFKYDGNIYYKSLRDHNDDISLLGGGMYILK